MYMVNPKNKRYQPITEKKNYSDKRRFYVMTVMFVLKKTN
jgi:hypothetical protein